MDLETFLRLVRKASNQSFVRHWLAYGSGSMNDPGLGLALGILCPMPGDERGWRAALGRDGIPPREMRMETIRGLPYLLAFWDRTDP